MKLGEIDRAITRVDAIRDAYARIDATEFEIVTDIRGRGGSWDSIGWLFGVTGDAVRQRFADRVDSRESEQM